MSIPQLGFYKNHPLVMDPEKSTEFAACFDIRAFFYHKEELLSYTRTNHKTTTLVNYDAASDEYFFTIEPFARVLVPTELIFDIPVGYSMRFHPRSGMGLKQALILGNCEGVIDADYIDPSCVILLNNSDEAQIIKHNDRICQAEMVIDLEYTMKEIETPPGQKSSRLGGFGSSGKQ